MDKDIPMMRLAPLDTAPAGASHQQSPTPERLIAGNAAFAIWIVAN
ncbi:hypothetical protein [Hoeflea sp. BAL378]|nr:hypothetical protein [Hoeflea sp. BAL378]